MEHNRKPEEIAHISDSNNLTATEKKLLDDVQGVFAIEKRIFIPQKELILMFREIPDRYKLLGVDEIVRMIEAAILINERVSTREHALKAASIESSETKKELSPEAINKYLAEFKGRFEAMSDLHPNEKWSEVEKALKADPESIRKLMKLDDAGFAMNVFRSKASEYIQFRTTQLDYNKIDRKYTEIMYDQKAQTDKPEYEVNGNAIDMAAKEFECELADPELYEQLKFSNGGWFWLKTDDTTRKGGVAFVGDNSGILKRSPAIRGFHGTFCAALKVKKA